MKTFFSWEISIFYIPHLSTQLSSLGEKVQSERRRHETSLSSLSECLLSPLFFKENHFSLFRFVKSYPWRGEEKNLFLFFLFVSHLLFSLSPSPSKKTFLCHVARPNQLFLLTFTSSPPPLPSLPSVARERDSHSRSSISNRKDYSPALVKLLFADTHCRKFIFQQAQLLLLALESLTKITCSKDTNTHTHQMK
jgi:hypothetical protein